MTELRPPVYAEGRLLLLAGIRQHHAHADAVHSIPAQWAQFQQDGMISPGAITYGAVCGNNPDRQTFEYMSAIEVPDFESVPADLGRMRIQAQRYAVFTHSGPVAKLRQTWAEIWNEWLPASGYQTADVPDFERYDERFDPVTGQGIVEIWFPIMPELGQIVTKTLPERVNP
jgi:AraC family transcriptional regulator